MSEVLIALAASGVFFAAMGIRGVFGYLKNKKISDYKFDWRKFFGGSLNPVALTLSIGALASLILAFLKLVGVSGIPVSGLDQISVQTLIVGLFIADIGALGMALKEGLLAFGLSEKQIEKIRSTAATVTDDTQLGISIANEDGEIVASAETVTKKTVKEQLAGEGAVLPDGEEVEAGKGSAWNNTYPEPYRSAAKDSLVDPSTCYNRECVSYTAWKIKEATGSWPRRTGSMNAKEWIYRLPENGYKEVSAPRDGGCYVGVYPVGQYGHVVWFEGGNVISEYNYNYLGNYNARTTTLSQYRWYEIKAPATPAPAPTPAPVNKTAEQIADEIWAGTGGWGNDHERSQKIRAAGVDPAAVQAVINSKYYGNKPAEPKPTGDYHTVRKGETLGQIALDEGWATGDQLWGDSGYVNKLAARNNIADPDLIHVGDKIYKA